MSAVRVLIVDDEALARDRIRRLLGEEQDVEIVGEAGNGPDAVQLIRDLRPDIVCLDIQMPGMDGFGVLEAIGEVNPPMVLFITAYDEHAQKAFDVHAVDYVLKPVEAARFRRAFSRARNRVTEAEAAVRLGQLLETMRMFSGSDAASSVASSAVRSGGKPFAHATGAPYPGVAGTGTGAVGRGGADTRGVGVGAAGTGGAASTGSGGRTDKQGGGVRYASRLLVKEEGRMFFVRTADIDWIEADRNYVKLHVGKKTHSIRERMSHLEETLDPRVFARIHKSTIVNLNRVREMQQWFSGDYLVLLDDGTRLRLSRNYRERVEQQMSRE